VEGAEIIYEWEVVEKYIGTQNYVQKEENAIALALYLSTGYSDLNRWGYLTIVVGEKYDR